MSLTDRLPDTCRKPLKGALSFQNKSVRLVRGAIISEAAVGVCDGLTPVLDGVEHFCQQEMECGVELK